MAPEEPCPGPLGILRPRPGDGGAARPCEPAEAATIWVLLFPIVCSIPVRSRMVTSLNPFSKWNLFYKPICKMDLESWTALVKHRCSGCALPSPPKPLDAPGPLLGCPRGGPKEPQTPESKEWNILTGEAQSEPHWAARRPLQNDHGIRVGEWGEREAGEVRFKRSSNNCKHACLVAQSCPTLWDPKDCSPSGPSVQEIL